MAFKNAPNSWPSSSSSELAFTASSSSFHCCFNRVIRVDLLRPSKAYFFFFGLGRRLSKFSSGCGSRCSCSGLRHSCLHEGVSWSLSFIMSNGVNSREFPVNIINNILGVAKLIPPFKKPLSSKNIPFLYIQPFQDPEDLVFFKWSVARNLAPCESVL